MEPLVSQNASRHELYSGNCDSKPLTHDCRRRHQFFRTIKSNDDDPSPLQGLTHITNFKLARTTSTQLTTNRRIPNWT